MWCSKLLLISFHENDKGPHFNFITRLKRRNVLKQSSVYLKRWNIEPTIINGENVSWVEVLPAYPSYSGRSNFSHISPYKTWRTFYLMVTLLAGQLLVVTRMDTLKSGWTPYVYYTTPYSIPRYTIFMRIYWAHVSEKLGNQSKRQL